MSETIEIRGYGIPFRQFARVDDDCAFEKVFRGAFKNMIRDRSPVALKFWNHSQDFAVVASTREGSLELFEDEYGLGFRAAVDNRSGENWGYANALRRTNYCSVNFTDWTVGHTVENGLRTRHIARAAIDHIAIVDNTAAYHGTAAWRGDCSLDRTPARIRDAAAKWNGGYAASRARIVAQAAQPRTAAPRSVAAFCAARSGEWAAIQSMALQAVRSGAGPIVLGHAAFSRVVGQRLKPEDSR